jgi:hypothetical protein
MVLKVVGGGRVDASGINCDGLAGLGEKGKRSWGFMGRELCSK